MIIDFAIILFVVIGCGLAKKFKRKCRSLRSYASTFLQNAGLTGCFGTHLG